MEGEERRAGLIKGSAPPSVFLSAPSREEWTLGNSANSRPNPDGGFRLGSFSRTLSGAGLSGPLVLSLTPDSFIRARWLGDEKHTFFNLQ